MTNAITPSRDISRLIEIMAALRTPKTGCPWDLAQTFETIVPYTLEEAYEVADAIERKDLVDLKDELGDLLLQVVYHARMAEEAGAFSFGDVVEGVTKKMIRRHPHVFGDEPARSPADVDGLWARIKAEEQAEKAAARATTSPPPSWGTPGAGDSVTAQSGFPPTAPSGIPPTPSSSPQGGGEVESILTEVPKALPALSRAIKLQDKAAKVGFDWPNLAPVFDKLKEELAELEEVALPADPRTSALGGRLDEGESPSAIKEEYGDLLFVLANVARHLKLDPEDALRAANLKFVRRFQHIETRLAERGSSPEQSSLEEMDALWDEAKFLEDYEDAPEPDEEM